MAKLTNNQRARGYLESSLNAGLTNMPDDYRAAYEGQMHSHEQAYPGVREHALAGSDKHFDKPLSAGVREHQRHLRAEEGMEHAEVLKIRKRLNGLDGEGAASGKKPAAPASRAQRFAAAGRQTAGTARKAAGAGSRALSAGSDVLAGRGAGGNPLLQIIGIGLLLSLVYLLVAGKGVNTIGALATALTGGVRAFIASEDPIRRLETALGAGSAAAASTSTAGAASGATPGEPGVVGDVTPQTEAQAIAKHELLPPPLTSGGMPSGPLLEADLKLKAATGRLIAAHKLTGAQARKREERLIPRSRYPAFYHR
jgi:hypothetical protein